MTFFGAAYGRDETKVGNCRISGGKCGTDLQLNFEPSGFSVGGRSYVLSTFGAQSIKIERRLTTSALAVFVPFVTQELFIGGEAMYYGLNELSNNMIMLDRKRSRCPNGLVFGTSGSGKSMEL